jgi:hypothetical protein
MLRLGQSGEASNNGHFSLVQPLSPSVIATAQKSPTICRAIRKPAMQMVLIVERSQWQ